MNNAASYRNKAAIMEILAAFSLFMDEGINAVKEMYPQHVKFVREHANRTQTEVKKALLQKEIT